MSEILQKAKEFGVDVEWAIKQRRAYLNDQIVRLRKESSDAVQLFSGKNDVSRYLLLDALNRLNTQVQRFENELKYVGKESSGRITKEQIERARQYPLENLLTNIRNGKAVCISGSHEDKHPSMDARNGFTYCYSCGFCGDVIAVYRKLHNTDFVTAVRALSSMYFLEV